MNVEKFWSEVTPKSKTPKHRGGKVSTAKPPIPKPKPIKKNKPGIYWYENANVLFIIYPDYSIDVLGGTNSLIADQYFTAADITGWTRASDFDHYLGAL